jgi:hypothetical protein
LVVDLPATVTQKKRSLIQTLSPRRSGSSTAQGALTADPAERRVSKRRRRSEKCVCRQTADATKILLVACQTFPPRYGNSGINHTVRLY